MGFLAPLALFFGLSVPVLLVFYMLKVKRRPRRVSSTFLWRAVMEESRASHPLQKLRNHPLMLLQILALIALTLALARPTMNLAQRESQSVAVLIDASASMGMRSKPGGPTRLDEAKSKAARFIDGLPAGSTVSLIAFADRAEAVEAMTTDRARVQTALQTLRTKPSRGDAGQAISLASSLLATGRNPRLAIFSDSARPTDADWAELRGKPVTVEICGEPAANRAWTAFDLRRRSPSAPVYDLFGQVGVFGGERTEAVVKIISGEDTLEAKRVTLSPGAETGVVIEGLTLPEEGIIRATLELAPKKDGAGEDDPSEGGGAPQRDALALDDEIWAPLARPTRTRVLVCTPGNYFLGRALESMEDLEVVNVAPGGVVPEGDYAMAIYDRATPAGAPPLPALTIGLRDAGGGASTAGAEIEPGPVTHWDQENPVSANTEWETIDVFTALTVKPPPESRVLVSAGETPLVIAGRGEGGGRMLALTFDLFHSNFPLRAGFPIFMADAVSFLSGGRGTHQARALRGGEMYEARPPRSANAITLISPDGRRRSLRPGSDGRIAFADTDAPGVWTVEVDGKPWDRFGVNLLAQSESDPKLGEPITSDAAGAKTEAGLSEELRANREIWPWIAWVALAALLVEWGLFQRRAGWSG